MTFLPGLIRISKQLDNICSVLDVHDSWKDVLDVVPAHYILVVDLVARDFLHIRAFN